MPKLPGKNRAYFLGLEHLRSACPSGWKILTYLFMPLFYETVILCRRYFPRYWFRFTVGIFLGVLFGLSNALSLLCVFTVLNRLDNPAHVQEITQKGREIKEKKKEGESIIATTVHARVNVIKEELYLKLDPWLPLYGRDLTLRQVIGCIVLISFPAIFRGFLGYGNSYLMAWSGQRITNDVKLDAFKKIQSLSLDYFTKTTTAEMLGRIEGDGNSLNQFLKLGLCDLVKEPVTIVSLFATLVFIDWKLTLISLVFMPLCIIPTRAVTNKIKALGRMDFGTLIGQNAIAMESFQNIRITKAYNLEELQSAAFKKAGLLSARFELKSIQSKEMLNPMVQTLNSFGVAAVFIYAVWSHTLFSVLNTFILALITFYTPFKKLNGLGVTFTQLSLALERLVALFKMEPSVQESPQALPWPRFTQEINFNNVSFSYGDALILRGISFNVRRGERLGLAGESGSGKSSLLNLLFRFYDVTGGSITLDDQPIKSLKLADLRSQLALVSQDILLFNGTVADNIRYGKQDATPEEIQEAARRAHADHFIQELPQGYATPLGERGVRLSGGQRQRMAIARAFVRNAPILVLDEATASLDSASEAEVQSAIDELAENRTVICVAHRLSTLRDMNRIIVLEKGRIIEQGTFDELLRQPQGIFQSMAGRQQIFAATSPEKNGAATLTL